MNTSNNLQFVVLNPQKVAQMLNGERLAKERQQAATMQLEAENKPIVKVDTGFSH